MGGYSNFHSSFAAVISSSVQKIRQLRAAVDTIVGKRGQWYLLLELLVSGTVRRSHISRLEERPQLADDHFSPITASSLESFITVFESVRVQWAQNLASKEAGFFSFLLNARFFFKKK